MKKHLLLLTNLMLLAGVIGYLGWQAYHTPKIAYVRSAELVDKYLGVKEAQTQFQKKLTSWKISTDTLQQRVNATMNLLMSKTSQLSDQEKKQLRAALQRRRAALDRYQLNIEKQARQEKQKLLGGALKQINSFVEKYAKSQGYDVVLGTTESGSLMYATKALDITDEVLRALNKSYKQ